MITKTKLQGKTIEAYFDSIMETQSKGQPIELLVKMLSQRQRNHFASWLDDYTACKWHHVHIQNVKDVLFGL